MESVGIRVRKGERGSCEGEVADAVFDAADLYISADTISDLKSDFERLNTFLDLSVSLHLKLSIVNSRFLELSSRDILASPAGNLMHIE